MSAVKLAFKQFPAIDLLFFGLASLFGLAIGAAIIKVGNPVYVIGAALFPIMVLFIYFRPELGPIILVFLAFTRAPNVAPVLKDLPNVSMILSLALGLLLIIRWLLYSEAIEGWQRPGLFFISYLFIILATILWARDKTSVELGVVAYIKDAVLAFIIAISIRRMRTLRQVVWALLAAAIFLGTISIVQTLTGNYSNDYFGFGQVAQMNIIEGSEGIRIVGPDMDPNTYGNYMVMILPLALDRLFVERKPILKLIALGAAGIITLTTIFTFSRGAFLALVFTVGIFLILHPPKPIAILGALSLVVILWRYIPADYTARLSTLTYLIPGVSQDSEDESLGGVDVVTATRDVSFRGRLSENLVGLRMASDYPIFGVGLGNFKAHYLDYSSDIGLDNRREGRAAHNLFLEVWAELGLIGVGWYIALIWSMGRSLIRSSLELSREGKRMYASLPIAFFIGVLSFLFGSIFRHMTYPTHVWMLYGLALVIPYLAKQELLIKDPSI